MLESEIEFEWSSIKELSNIDKHGISFVAAARVFFSEYYEGRSDRYGEIRYLAVGEVEGRVLAVVYTRRGEKYRIISARRARKDEEAIYRKKSTLSS